MPVDKLDGLVDAPLFEQISNRSREERNCAIGRSGDVTMPTSPAGATPLRFPALCPPPVDPGGGRPSASDAFEAISDGRRERSATGWSIGRGARSLDEIAARALESGLVNGGGLQLLAKGCRRLVEGILASQTGRRNDGSALNS